MFQNWWGIQDTWPLHFLYQKWPFQKCGISLSALTFQFCKLILRSLSLSLFLLIFQSKSQRIIHLNQFPVLKAFKRYLSEELKDHLVSIRKKSPLASIVKCLIVCSLCTKVWSRPKIDYTVANHLICNTFFEWKKIKIMEIIYVKLHRNFVFYRLFQRHSTNYNTNQKWCGRWARKKLISLHPDLL